MAFNARGECAIMLGTLSSVASALRPNNPPTSADHEDGETTAGRGR